MILTDDAAILVEKGAVFFSSLEATNCPRCKQRILFIPENPPRRGDVCDDCMNEWFDELYE